MFTDQSVFFYDALVGLGGGTICRCCAEGDVHLRFVAEVSEVFLDLKPDVFCVNLCLCVDTYAIACCMVGRRRAFCFSSSLVRIASSCALCVGDWNPFRHQLPLEAAGFLRVFVGLKKSDEKKHETFRQFKTGSSSEVVAHVRAVSIR